MIQKVRVKPHMLEIFIILQNITKAQTNSGPRYMLVSQHPEWYTTYFYYTIFYTIISNIVN